MSRSPSWQPSDSEEEERLEKKARKAKKSLNKLMKDLGVKT